MALPDSGSACNIAGASFVNKIKLPVTQTNPKLYSITSAMGHPLPIIGTAMARVLLAGGRDILTNLSLSPSQVKQKLGLRFSI